MRWTALGLLLLSACNSQTSEEKAAADARDVAAVENAQKQEPPPRPLALQPILFPDIQRHALYGAGCAFVADGGGLGAVVMTDPKRAAIKPGDELEMLASDPGSGSMPLGTWSRYVGKVHALTLTRTGEKKASDAQFAGKLVVTDAFDHVVHEASGLIQCKE